MPYGAVGCNFEKWMAEHNSNQKNGRDLMFTALKSLAAAVSTNEKVGRKRRERIAVVCVFEIAKTI